MPITLVFLFGYNSSEFRISRTLWPDAFQYEALFTHEITHAISFLLTGYDSHDNLLVSTWFDEGLAVYIARDDYYYIYTWNQLDNLHQILADVPGQGNPILISKWEDIPSEYFSGDMLAELYALFEVAVRYLVDTYGIEKCRQLYIDTRSGMSFEEAFTNQYGMSLANFQETFFTRMQAFLP